MRQLVQLAKQADEFKSLNAEIICILREEGDGVNGLKKAKKATDTPFTLALDQNKKTTKPYSTKNKTFDNFVIDKNGVVKAIIPGTLRDRATAEELIKELKKLQ